MPFQGDLTFEFAAVHPGLTSTSPEMSSPLDPLGLCHLCFRDPEPKLQSLQNGISWDFCCWRKYLCKDRRRATLGYRHSETTLGGLFWLQSSCYGCGDRRGKPNAYFDGLQSLLAMSSMSWILKPCRFSCFNLFSNLLYDVIRSVCEEFVTFSLRRN